MKKVFFYESPLGKIGVAEYDGSITNLFFGKTVIPEDYSVEETSLLKNAGCQLKEYFAGERKTFDLPLAPEGTEFEKAVWKELCSIPYGKTVSYLNIATKVGNPNACRAVGRANGRNPISIFIPCHRVVGSNGKLTGYAGGLPAKELLLNLEKGKG